MGVFAKVVLPNSARPATRADDRWFFMMGESSVDHS